MRRFAGLLAAVAAVFALTTATVPVSAQAAPATSTRPPGCC
jgi:hypothetical protein